MGPEGFSGHKENSIKFGPEPEKTTVDRVEKNDFSDFSADEMRNLEGRVCIHLVPFGDDPANDTVYQGMSPEMKEVLRRASVLQPAAGAVQEAIAYITKRNEELEALDDPYK